MSIEAMRQAHDLSLDGNHFAARQVLMKAIEQAENRKWVGLTDEEMYKLWLCADEDNDRMSFGKAVETKLKEKNHVS